jgi:hypothetical protein
MEFITQLCNVKQFKLGHHFCWWDKLHRTLRRDVPQKITIGVAAYRDEKGLTLGNYWFCRFADSARALPSGEEPAVHPGRR